MPTQAYLDWNATAKLRPQAQAAVAAALNATGNPSSVHAAGRAARQTGAAVVTHGMPWAEEQFRLLREEGLDPERIVISHLDDTMSLDFERDQRLARQGAFVAYVNAVPARGSKRDQVVKAARSFYGWGIKREVVAGQLSSVRLAVLPALTVGALTGPTNALEVARAKPSAMVLAISFGSFTRKLCLVIGIVMPRMSASWKASVPIAALATWPVIATSGTESM